MRYIVEAKDRFGIDYIRNVYSKELAFNYMESMLKVLGKGVYVRITNVTKGVVIAEATKINLRGGC